MNKAITITVLVFILVGCTPATPDPGIIQTAIAETQTVYTQETATAYSATQTATPLLSPLFVSQTNTFLDKASSLNSRTGTGITYAEMRELVGDAHGSFDNLKSMYPAIISKEPLEKFEAAFLGWQLTLDLWDMKINELDNPVEPDINGYLDYLGYAEKYLVIDTHPSDFIVGSYRGKKFIPFDENIGILMAVASDHFEEGRSQMLTILGQ